MTSKVYFAHPIKTYNTREEAEILRALKERFPPPKWEIINPADERIRDFTSCKQCMTEHMIPVFFRYVKECKVFIIWDAKGSCGVRCELNKAWELGKIVEEVTYMPLFKSITLQEYHYSRGSREANGNAST